MSGYSVDWTAVRDFLYRRPVGRTHIIAGTPEWCELPDDDPRKVTALIIAGSRWVLEEEIAELQARRDAEKAAAIEIAAARDWVAVARRIRDRDLALRTGAHIPRRTA